MVRRKPMMPLGRAFTLALVIAALLSVPTVAQAADCGCLAWSRATWTTRALASAAIRWRDRL